MLVVDWRPDPSDWGISVAIAPDLTAEAVENLRDIGFTVAKEIELGVGQTLFRLKKTPAMRLD